MKSCAAKENDKCQKQAESGKTIVTLLEVLGVTLWPCQMSHSHHATCPESLRPKLKIPISSHAIPQVLPNISV